MYSTEQVVKAIPSELEEFLRAKGMFVRFINNIDINVMATPMAFAGPISQAFVWHNTREGRFVWATLHKKFEEEYGPSRRDGIWYRPISLLESKPDKTERPLI